MTALILRPDPITIVSASPIQAITPASNLVSDTLGLDIRSTSSSVTIVIDRGAGAGTFDTLALVNTTIGTGATYQIVTSNNVDMSAPTYTSAAGFCVTTPNSARRTAVIASVPTNSSRYVRIAMGNLLGTIDISRAVVGTALITDGVDMKAERTFDDRSDSFEVGAYQTFDERPTLLGWKVGLPWFSNTEFRTIWQPFFQTVGISRPFLFLPQFDDINTWQHDWCYGRLTSKSVAQNQGHDMWTVQMAMRSIFP